MQWDVPVAFAVFKPQFNESGDGIESAEFVYANEFFCRGVGFTPEQLVGRKFADVFPGETP